MIDRQRLDLGGGIETGLVDYVVTSTANQSGLVTLTFDLLTLQSRVTWATSANFSLPRPLCSRLRPDVCDRPTDRRQTASSLNVPPIRGRSIITRPTVYWIVSYVRHGRSPLPKRLSSDTEED